MQVLKDRVRERSLPGLDLGPGAQEPLGLSFRNASLRETYLALGRAAGVNFVFDPAFQDPTISIDLRDVPFEQALNALGSVGRTFHRVLDARVVNVIPDTPAKRRDNEQQVVRTFFLSNADLKETIDLLRIVLGARRVAPLPGANALTINDTPDKVAAAERIVNIVDKQRAEVMVEVEILEVNRTRLKEYGIEITSGPDPGGIRGAIFPRGTIEEVVRDTAGQSHLHPERPLTLDDNPYSASNLLVTNLPGGHLPAAEDRTRRRGSSPTPSCAPPRARPRRRGSGTRCPVPITVFAPIATGGVAQQPITSFEYKNVGVNIDITPRVHHDGDVTLVLKLEISSLGPLVPGQPDLPQPDREHHHPPARRRDQHARRSDQRRGADDLLTGLPGLASLPLVLGRLFAANRIEGQETDIVMTLTPHIVRQTTLTEEDLRSFSVGTETRAAPVRGAVRSCPWRRRTPALPPRRGRSPSARRAAPVPSPSPIG